MYIDFRENRPKFLSYFN